MWRRLGAQVVILEAAESLLSSAIHDRAEPKAVPAKGWIFVLAARSRKSTIPRMGAVHYADGENNESIGVDRLIVAVGRRPCTDGLWIRIAESHSTTTERFR